MSLAEVTTGILIRRGTGVAGTAKTIVSNSVDPTATVVTTSTAHGLVSGQSVTIAGATGGTPSINGVYKVKVLTTLTFSIPLAVTVAGTGGTVTAVEVYDTIAEITSVTPPGFSRNKLESSTHNDGTESNVLGMLRQKDPSFTVNYLGNNTTHQSILADIMGNLKKNWLVTFPSGIAFDGPARVQNFELADAPPDAIQQADVTLTWAGPITLTV